MMFERLLLRKYSLSIAFLLYLLIGFLCWKQIPLELSPDAQLPVLTVSVSWARTSPEVMEQEITRRIEQSVYALRNIEKVASTTTEGRAQVSITFQKNTNIDFRLVELRDVISEVMDQLPFPMPPPVYSRSVPEELEDLQRFMVFSLSFEQRTEDLLQTARQSIQLPLLGLEGLSDIELEGMPENALVIRFQTEMLERLGLRVSTVMQSLSDFMQSKPIGNWTDGAYQFNMVQSEGDSLLKRLPTFAIQIPGSSKTILLGQLASFSIEPASVQQIRRINGKRTVTIQLKKEAGADALKLAAEVEARMLHIRKNLSDQFVLLKEYDATEQIRKQLDELSIQAWYSLALVFFVLVVFMRSLRAPAVIIGTILLSLTGTIIGLYMLDYTLNIITQAALTISFGLLVDNAVVIYDHLRDVHQPDKKLAVSNIRQALPGVLIPVLGSTLTTIVIFVPLIFALPELRVFLEPIAITISLALVFSMLCGFVWIPFSMLYLVPQEKENQVDKNSGSGSIFQRPFLYLLIWIRKLRWVLWLVFVALVGIPLHLIPEYKAAEVAEGQEEMSADSTFQFLSDIHKTYDENRETIEPWVGGLWRRFQKDIRFSEPWRWGGGEKISVYIETPPGSPLEELDKMVTHFETVANPYLKDLDYYESEISEFYGARLIFHIKPEALQHPGPYILKGELMYLGARTGNASISVSGLGDGFSNYGGGSGGQITLELIGYSYDELNELSAVLKAHLLKNSRVSDVKTNRGSWFDADNLFQFVLIPNETSLMLNGLNRPQLFDRLQTELNPDYRWGYVELGNQKIQLLAKAERQSKRLEEFSKRTFYTDSSALAISTIAHLTKEPVQSVIRRENQQYTRFVSFEFRGSQRFARQFAEEVVATFPLPVGTKLQFPKLLFFMEQETKGNAGYLVLLCLFCVALTIAATLESVRNTLWVLLAIPLGAIGVMAGALYLDMYFGRGAIAGTLLLMGIIVNNSILLVFCYQAEAVKGTFGIRAWFRVFKDRINAILVTTITTIAGLAPILWMSTDVFWTQLATIVAWGLGIGSILLFILFPTFKGGVISGSN